MGLTQELETANIKSARWILGLMWAADFLKIEKRYDTEWPL